MAQLTITLNQEEIQALFLEDCGEAFKKILQTGLNKILQAESAEQLKAGPYERSEERTDSRNGSRDRDLILRQHRTKERWCKMSQSMIYSTYEQTNESVRFHR